MLNLKVNFVAFLITTLLLSNLFCSNVYSDDGKTYRFGVVPQFEARRLHAIWSPILKELNNQTGYNFILEGAPTIAEFEKLFMAGHFDFAYMNPYHFILANQLQGYLPLIRDVGKTLHGVLVVKNSSKIENVKDLDGKKIAFPSPNALGASLQMRQELHDDFNIAITPVYVKTHDSVYLNVLLDKTKAGGGVQKTLSRQPKQYQDALRVIHKTRKVSPHPIAANPKVEEKVRQAIQKAFLKMAKTELLSKVPIKKVGIATMEDYDVLNKMNLDRFYVKPK